MVENQKLVKISDVVENQIPEFILEDNPNFAEFLKQYYLSQEFQGAPTNLSENLSSYKNFSSFDSNNLIESTTLSSDIEFFDDEIYVGSTLGWPSQYGLLKINNEIITYTGITTNSFTGCIRGFSGVDSLSQENNPEFLSFSTTESDSHISGSIVYNLSNLFLIEFFKKQKTLYAPGFEKIDFDEKINPQNFLSKVRTFYQSKGTDEAYKILFKVLYGENVKIIRPREYCFTTSDDKWVVTETFICSLISGDPFKIEGQTLYQPSDPYNKLVSDANGSIYAVDSFLLEGEIYYKIRIFSGYSNNLNPKGSISGTFVPTFKTSVVEYVNSGSDTIFVDSTVGFPKEGLLYIGENTYSYTDKTNNQFLNVKSLNENVITEDINRKSIVYSTNYVVSYEDGNLNSPVLMRVNNVLSSVESFETLYAIDGDPIKIENIGYTDNNVFVNSLKFNLPTSIYAGKAVTEITDGVRSFDKQGFSITNGLVLSKYDHLLRDGDLVDLYVKNFGEYSLYSENLQVVSYLSKEFSVQKVDDPTILGKDILFRRKLKKTKAVSFTKLYNNIQNKYTANIQDAYADSNYNYVTSNGLPDYEVNPYVKEFTFSASELNDNTLIGSHNFYTGESVKVVGYAVSGSFSNRVGFYTGDTYYVYRVSPNVIRLSETRESVGITSTNLIEIDINNNISGKLEDIVLISSPLYGNQFSTTKTFKKIPKVPQVKKEKVATNPGPLGIFVNGIEIQNYKSFDKIHYGQIDTVDVLNGGSEYSLLTPPQFRIFNNYFDEDTETFLIPEMEGSLVELKVTNPGYDYEGVPSVIITGGNREDVPTTVKMRYIDKVKKFNATTKDTVVRTLGDYFQFSSIHPFVDGEAVVYETFGTFPIGIGTVVNDGTLLDQGVYYVSTVGSATSIRIANTKEDAINGTNLINLRTTGGGVQQFRSLEKIQVIDKVSFVGIQSGFKYKKLSFGVDNINIFDNIFYFDDHQYDNGEEVIVTSEGTPLGGITEGQIYYIDKLDNNSFRLTEDKKRTQIVNISDLDFATTYFVQYPPIEVSIDGKIKKTASAVTGYGATIVPVVRGYVKKVEVQRGLSKPAKQLLGEKNIINYHKKPLVQVLEGYDGEFYPLIQDGKIIDVIVKNAGQKYFNDFELVITGQGYGAEISPVISNGEIYNGQISYGQIIDVKIINPGVGYASTDTVVKVVNKGKNLKVSANLVNWTLNEVSKLGISNLRNGYLFGAKYSKFGNTFGTFFLDSNLINSFGIQSAKHSPIVGWAYDGCPIYGPYAYEFTNGSGSIIRMVSGYTRNKVSPSQSIDCIEDYTFTNTGTLDENNGRFAVTPEYPQGIYAYYCTIDENNNPVFPYIIGNTFNYIPEESNFNVNQNQDLNFNDLGIIKYTRPYRVEDKENYYEYFNLVTKSPNPDAIINSTSGGSIKSVDIVDGGFDYEIGDKIEFEDELSGGVGAFAVVNSISGVSISTITSGITSFSDVVFYSSGSSVVGVATTAHGFKNATYINISGISTTEHSSLEGFFKINVEESSTVLSEALPDASTTGLVTSIKVKAPVIGYNIDDEVKIGSEVLRIVGVDNINSRLNVLRYSGSPGYSTGSTVSNVVSSFTLSDFNYNKSISQTDDSYYFNPVNSISVGISTIAGVGNTLTSYPLGVGVSITKYIEHGQIYLPNHKFKTGDRIVYSNNGSSITTNAGLLSDLPNIFVVKISEYSIGLVQDIKDINNWDALLRYNAVGTGNLHKFKTQRPNIVTGDISQVNVNVSLASSHGLDIGNNINLKVISGITTTFTVGYANTSKRVLIDSQINPQVKVYSNDIVVFDLTDSTISGKDFNLYSDEFFRNPYFGNEESGIEVIKSNTQLTLNITENTPKILYYNLVDITSGEEIYSDFTVTNNNQLKIESSLYNRSSKIIGVTSTTFDYNLPVYPERSEYTSSLSDLSYSVLDSGIKGPVNSLKLIYGGYNYKRVPDIKKITTTSGKGLDLFPVSTTIGNVKSIKILNTETVYPSDKTLSPVSNTFSALKIKDSYVVSGVSVSHAGKNYRTSPTLILYNQTTGEVDDKFQASAIVTKNTVERVVVTNKSSKLKSTDDKVLAINNSNGVRILNASSSGSDPYLVELTLETPISGFTTSNPIPFSVGDEIFVENIIASTGSGYNSSDYGYSTFTVTYVNQNTGSPNAATIRYELDKFPGVFSALTFNATVSLNDNIAKFETTLEKSKYFNSEIISPLDKQIINNPNNEPITNIIKVHNSDGLKIDDEIVGKTSNAASDIYKIEKFNSSLKLDSSVSESIGWKDFRGNLSSILQKLQDSDYYQNFSYSLKSRKSYTEWQPILSDLSHVSGYKQFGDLSVESQLPVSIGSTLTVGSDQSSLISISLVSEQDVTSIQNFDLVIEEDIDESDGVYSEYLKFTTKKLSDYILSRNNRVLSIDDISNQFDTDNSPFLTVAIDTVDTTDEIVLKYFFFISSTISFFGDFELPQIMDVFVNRTGPIIDITSYAYYYDFYNNGIVQKPLGEIKANISPTNDDEVTIEFVPKNIFNSYSIAAVKETASLVAGITSTSYGYVDTIESTQEYAASGSPSSQVVYSYPLADLESGIGFIGVSSATKRVEESFEFSFVKNVDNVIDFNVFAESKTKNLGTFGISTTPGGSVEFTYTPAVGIALTVMSNLQIIHDNPTSPYDVVTDLTVTTSENYNYSGSSQVGVTTVPQTFAATKYIVQAEKTVGLSTERSIFQISAVHFKDYNNLVSYGFAGNMSPEEFAIENVYNPSGPEYILSFTPKVSGDYNFKIIKKSIISSNI